MLTTLALTVAGVYGILCLALFLGQQRLVYFPTRALDATPAGLGLAYEDRWLETTDGVRLHAWWIPAPGDGPVVLFLHGNAGNISHRLDTIRLLHGLEAGVLIPDYRGYGRSAGTPDEHGTYLDALAAHEHLIGTLGVPATRVVVMGRSLGGGVAAWLAAERPCGGLVVESSYTSVPDLAAEIYPLFPVRLLARIRYPAAAHIARARCPVLVVHSRDDEMIPFRHGERLFEAAAQPKQLVAIRGGHNEGFMESGALYRDAIAQFLRQIAAAPG